MDIRNHAEAYEPTQTKNISDLESVDVTNDIETKTYQDKDGKDFSVDVINVEGEDYRIPVSVTAQLKVMLKEKPDLENFKVVRSGEGMNTKYTVIPL